MVPKEDKEKISLLIKDTLTALCKNGLQFKTEFSIDATIGITLDEDEVVLVSVSETLMKEPVPDAPSASTVFSSPKSSYLVKKVAVAPKTSGRRGRRSKKGRPRSVQIQQEESEEETETADHSYTAKGDGEEDEATAVEEEDSIQMEVEHPPETEEGTVTVMTQNTEDGGTQYVVYGSSVDLEAALNDPSVMSVLDSSNQPVLLEVAPDNHQIKQEVEDHDFENESTEHAEDFGNLSGDTSIRKTKKERKSVGNKACSFCGKMFSSGHIHDHEKKHKGIFRYRCSHCDKGFMARSTYEGHLAKHEGTKKYSCQVCGKEYTYLKGLQYHRRTAHSGMPKKRCTECGKDVLLIYYPAHENSHRGIFNHYCNLCEKGFRTIGRLNIHMAAHEGRKDYRCEYCGKTYRFKHSLKGHIQSMHPKLELDAFTAGLLVESEEVQVIKME